MPAWEVSAAWNCRDASSAAGELECSRLTVHAGGLHSTKDWQRPAQEAALCARTCELRSVPIYCVNRRTAPIEHSAANDRGLRESG